jgi:hypothetical protein
LHRPTKRSQKRIRKKSDSTEPDGRLRQVLRSRIFPELRRNPTGFQWTGLFEKNSGDIFILVDQELFVIDLLSVGWLLDVMFFGYNMTSHNLIVFKSMV